MAAAAMVAAAFQNVCRQVDWVRDSCPAWINADRLGMRLCSQLSRSLGAAGAAGGQFIDSLDEKGLAEYVIRGHSTAEAAVQKKTSPFFENAFVGGWLIGGAAAAEVEELRKAGQAFGAAFQIADDISDMTQDRLRRAQGKPGWNYANTYGRCQAEREICRQLSACRRTLQSRGLFTPMWQEVYDKVWTKAETG